MLIPLQSRVITNALNAGCYINAIIILDAVCPSCTEDVRSVLTNLFR